MKCCGRGARSTFCQNLFDGETHMCYRTFLIDQHGFGIKRTWYMYYLQKGVYIMYICIFICTQRCIQMYIRICIFYKKQAYIHTYIHMHTNTHMWVHIDVHSYIHVDSVICTNYDLDLRSPNLYIYIKPKLLKPLQISTSAQC